MTEEQERLLAIVVHNADCAAHQTGCVICDCGALFRKFHKHEYDENFSRKYPLKFQRLKSAWHDHLDAIDRSKRRMVSHPKTG